MERLAPLLYNIGEKHVQFIDRGFIPEFWDTFLVNIFLYFLLVFKTT